MKSGSVPNFEEEIYRVFREAVRSTAEAGLASLEEEEDPRPGWDCLLLSPMNPEACELRVYADYPTLCMGAEQICTELFGSEHERLEQLPKLVRALIAGGYEWEYRQAKFLGLVRFTQLRGTFHTEDGPWMFTRQGASMPRGAIEHRTYPPY